MRRYHTLSPDDITPLAIERLERDVYQRRDHQCWEWCASALPSGYGRLRIKGRSEYAHRIAYVIHTQQSIPPGMVVMHSCDNPSCCNPYHLSLGTYADNSQDRERKGRGRKWSEDEGGYVSPNKGRFVLSGHLDEIADLYRGGMTAPEIACHFGVGLSTAQKAIRMSGVETRGPGRRSGNIWHEKQGVKNRSDSVH